MQFRLTLVSLVAAFALASLSQTVANEDQLQSLATQELDEAGNVFTIVNDGDDPDGDDDDVVHVRRARKHKHKSGRKSKQHYTVGPDHGAKAYPNKMQITWYASNDLKNPACGDGKWDPNNNSHIGAVMTGWKSGPQCGEFIQICNKDAGNKCVRVRIVDHCAGCDADAVDLTKSAFKKLSPSGTLDEGRIHNLEMYHSSKPNPFNVDLFGPFKLLG